ncbi:hypothetical protein [Nocardia sp. NPDC050413]|uniref:hypothetical protein n=1 Tax=Nocardia sp. NPDC050413 TaxID=3155784 RepID=UPI0033E72A28
MRITQRFEVASNAALLTGASLYVTQVREFLAPTSGLLERDDELRMLAEFCRGDEPYLWIRANPWAGKSALLAWFALNPPDDVTVISFFVTDRLADQNSHTAFTDAVLDQLAVLLPEQRALIAAAMINRDGLRNELLAIAARELAAEDRRLVLVVDGLDEDIGKPPIVNLLPRLPVPNLRVIVASRHGPHLRIVAGHPLRDAAIHRLARSDYAAGIRDRAIEELDQLLSGPERFRSLLALITAANGLSTTELVELTDLAPYEIDDLVRGVSGRSFRAKSRSPELDGSLDPIHALAHETLQRTAEQRLGARLLRESRDRLHAWADEYRQAGWPPETPDFLLRRYFSILDRADDHARMAKLALDTARHDRLRAHTGGDAVALTEIRTVQQRICAQPDPDLYTTAHLARLRDQHRDYNAGVPTSIPALWARLGHLDRGESLALSLPNPARQADALLDLVEEIAEREPRRARRIVDRTEKLIVDDVDPTPPELGLNVRTHLLMRLATTVADPAYAERLLARVCDDVSRDYAIKQVAQVIAKSDVDRAHALARTATDSAGREEVLARIAPIVVAADPERAEAIIGELIEPGARWEALTRTCRALAATDRDRAVRFAEQAEAMAVDFREPVTRAYAFADVASAVHAADSAMATRLGQEVEALASALTEPDQRFSLLVRLAWVVAAFSPQWSQRVALRAESMIGDHDVGDIGIGELAELIARTDPEHAERLTFAITDPGGRAEALVGVVRAAADADPDRAEAIAGRILDLEWQASALTSIAWAIAETRSAHAAELTVRARALAGATIDQEQHAETISLVAAAISRFWPERAETLARTVLDPKLRADALIHLVRSAGTEPAHDARLVESASELVAAMPDDERRRAMLTHLIPAIARIDPDRAVGLALRSFDDDWRPGAVTALAVTIANRDPERAETVVASLPPTAQPSALVRVAGALADTHPEDAVRLVDDAVRRVERWPDPMEQALVHAAAAAVMVDLDDSRAVALGQRAVDLPPVSHGAVLGYLAVRGSQMARIVGSLARVDPDAAEALAHRLDDSFWRGYALALAAGAVATSDAQRAEALARTITDPERQAHTFTRIAEEIAARSPARAKRLLALAWLSGRWAIPLSGLREVDLPALRALVSDVFGDE